MKKEFCFYNLPNAIVWQRKLDFIIGEGWKIIKTEPIGETSIKLYCKK